MTQTPVHAVSTLLLTVTSNVEPTLFLCTLLGVLEKLKTVRLSQMAKMDEALSTGTTNTTCSSAFIEQVQVLTTGSNCQMSEQRRVTYLTTCSSYSAGCY